MLYSIDNGIHGPFKKKKNFVNISHTACFIPFQHRPAIIEKPFIGTAFTVGRKLYLYELEISHSDVVQYR